MYSVPVDEISETCTHFRKQWAQCSLPDYIIQPPTLQEVQMFPYIVSGGNPAYSAL